jgi:hypothetical protein
MALVLRAVAFALVTATLRLAAAALDFEVLASVSDAAVLVLGVAAFALDVLALALSSVAAALARAGLVLVLDVVALVLRAVPFVFRVAVLPLDAAVLAFVDADLALGVSALAPVRLVLARVVVFLVLAAWATLFRAVTFFAARLAGPLLESVLLVVARFTILSVDSLFVADFFAIKSCPPEKFLYSIPLHQRLSVVVI